MTGVRWREDTGFEGKCEVCREYLPLTPEFWVLDHGLRRCASCWALYKRLKQRGYAVRNKDVILAAQRERYRMMPVEQKARHNEATRAWKAANRERIREYNAAYRARKAA